MDWVRAESYPRQRGRGHLRAIALAGIHDDDATPALLALPQAVHPAQEFDRRWVFLGLSGPNELVADVKLVERCQHGADARAVQADPQRLGRRRPLQGADIKQPPKERL